MHCRYLKLKKLIISTPIVFILVFTQMSCSNGKSSPPPVTPTGNVNDNTGGNTNTTELNIPESMKNYNFKIQSDADYLLPKIHINGRGDKLVFWVTGSGTGAAFQYAIFDKQLNQWLPEQTYLSLFRISNTNLPPDFFEVAASQNEFAFKWTLSGKIKIDVLEKTSNGWAWKGPNIINATALSMKSNLRSDGKSFMLASSDAIISVFEPTLNVYIYRNNSWENTFTKTNTLYVNLFSHQQGYALLWSGLIGSRDPETLTISLYNNVDGNWQTDVVQTPFSADKYNASNRVQFAASNKGFCVSRLNEPPFKDMDIYAQVYVYGEGWKADGYLTDFNPDSTITSFRTVIAGDKCAVAWLDTKQSDDRLFARVYDISKNNWGVQSAHTTLDFPQSGYYLVASANQIGLYFNLKTTGTPSSINKNFSQVFSVFDSVWTDHTSPISGNLYSQLGVFSNGDDFLFLDNSANRLELQQRKFSNKAWTDPVTAFAPGTKVILPNDAFFDIISLDFNLNIPLTFTSLSEGNQVHFAFLDTSKPGMFFSDYDGTRFNTTQLNLSYLGGSSIKPQLAVNSLGQMLAVWKQHGSPMKIYGAIFDGSTWSAVREIAFAQNTLLSSLTKIEIKPLSDGFMLVTSSQPPDRGAVITTKITVDGWVSSEVIMVSSQSSYVTVDQDGLGVCWLNLSSAFSSTGALLNRVSCSSYTSDTWTPQTVVYEIPASTQKIEGNIHSIDGLDRPVLLWEEKDSQNQKILTIAAQTQGQWSTYHQIFPEFQQGTEIAAAKFSNTNEVLVYWSGQGQKFYHWTTFNLDTAKWSQTVTTSTVTQTEFLPKLLNFNGKNILFSALSGAIRVSNYVDGNWNSIANIIPVSTGSLNYGIQINKNLMTLYWDESPEFDRGSIKYRHYDGSTWGQPLLLDTPANIPVGQPYATLYNQTPVIAYAVRQSEGSITTTIALKFGW